MKSTAMSQDRAIFSGVDLQQKDEKIYFEEKQAMTVWTTCAYNDYYSDEYNDDDMMMMI